MSEVLDLRQNLQLPGTVQTVSLGTALAIRQQGQRQFDPIYSRRPEVVDQVVRAYTLGEDAVIQKGRTSHEAYVLYREAFPDSPRSIEAIRCRWRRTVPPEQRQHRSRVVRTKPGKLPVWARIDPSIPIGAPGTGWRPEEIAAIKEARSPAEAVTLYKRAFPTSLRGKGGIYEAFKRMGFGWRS